MGQRHKQSSLDLARDELFSHIQRCGVLEADDEERTTWLKDTVEYLGERYADLTAAQLEELAQIGRNYCQPAIAYGETDVRDQEESVEPDEVSST